jgi:translation initiation factor 2B subunit (eIF-2B alpha/beta/delta family)
MANNAALENFIKKYRLAVTNKSKDIRLTVEEAGDLVASIAMINLHDEKLLNVHSKLDTILKALTTVSSQQAKPSDDGVDGGSFKG